MYRNKETIDNEKTRKQKVKKKNRVHYMDATDMFSSDGSTTDVDLSLHVAAEKGAYLK